MKLKLIRNLLKGASLTTALFVFQACYGVPGYFDQGEMVIAVTDAVSGESIPLVDINMRYFGGGDPWYLAAVTDNQGQASVFVSTDIERSSIDLSISSENGLYSLKDTTVTFTDGQRIDIKLKKAE